MPRFSARAHLLGLIAVAVVPVWLFAAYLLSQYAFVERERFEHNALQAAHQASLVVEAELSSLLTVIDGLAKSTNLAQPDLAALHDEAVRLVGESDRIVVLLDEDGQELLDTRFPVSSRLPQSIPLADIKAQLLQGQRRVVSDTYLDESSEEYRVFVAVPISNQGGATQVLALSVPTSIIRDIIVPTVEEGWTLAVGDRNGAYVARIQDACGNHGQGRST